MVAGTLVQWREPRHLLGKNLTINVVAHAWRGAAVDVIGVVLQVTPRKDLEEGTQRPDIGPRRAKEDGALWRLVTDEVL